MSGTPIPTTTISNYIISLLMGSLPDYKILHLIKAGILKEKHSRQYNILEIPENHSVIMFEHYISVQYFSQKATPVSMHSHRKTFCEIQGIQYLALEGGSNKPTCHHQAQAPITIFYLGIPYTPPCRHQHVCMRLCPLNAPLTQVHPFSYNYDPNYVHPPGGWIYYFCFFRRPMSVVRCPASDVRRHAWFPLI